MSAKSGGPDGRERGPGTPAGDTGAGGRELPGPDAPDDEAGLEVRLRRLEEIVSALEADDLELERALELFEEGVTHVRRAEAILAETELRVEELLDDAGDGGATRPFVADDDG